MTIQILLTVWSIRLALLLLAVAVTQRLIVAGNVAAPPDGKWARRIWLAGCLLAVVHVLAVFGYLMNWSHTNAFNDTAEQTRRLIGVPFGGGVYFNYLFLVVWVADASWWYGSPGSYQNRSRWWTLLLIGYLCFIALNATVVFEDGLIRGFGLLATAVVVVAACRARWVRKNLP